MKLLKSVFMILFIPADNEPSAALAAGRKYREANGRGYWPKYDDVMMENKKIQR